MALATTLHTSAVAALSKSNAPMEYTKLKAILTLDAASGVFESKYRFPTSFNQTEKDEIKTSLKTDGFVVDQNKDTGFLVIRW